MTVWNDLHGIVGRPRAEESDELYERRFDIARAALRVAARCGLGAASMRAIGAEAGIVAGGLYRHFQSKTDVMQTALMCAEQDEAHERDAHRPPTTADVALRLELFAAILRSNGEIGTWSNDVEWTLRAAAERLSAAGCGARGPARTSNRALSAGPPSPAPRSSTATADEPGP